MATLFRQKNPWMEKSNLEAEERVERKVAQNTKQKIEAVHKRLVAFEMRVLALPSPTVDLTTLKHAMSSL